MEWGVFFLQLKQEAIQNGMELKRTGFQPILQKNETTNIGFSQNDECGCLVKAERKNKFVFLQINLEAIQNPAPTQNTIE